MTEEKLPRRPSWERLRDIVDLARITHGQAIRDYLLQWPERLRAAGALALSCAHWSRGARSQYNDAGQLHGAVAQPPSKRFSAGTRACGLCQQFLDSYTENCGNCPLYVSSGSCFSEGLYREVNIAMHQDKGFHAAADALYNKLVELYVEELRLLGYDA